MIGSITVSDINEALPRALPMLLRRGKPQTAASVANARPTREWPGLFITEYLDPTRNVLFDPIRNANPFFHYLEAMWIIHGRNDVKFLAHVLPRMADYSDDGETFHGAYGHRLRHWTGHDQIEQAIAILRQSPASRQVVMSIWDPARDLGAATKDMPCNDMIMLKIRDGRLNMTVNNRSNDVIWGCYGANVVQFSMLQMYMAARIGVKVGVYLQVSDSFHVYEDNPYWLKFKEEYPTDPGAWEKKTSAGVEFYKLNGSCNLFEDGVNQVNDELTIFFAEAERSIESGQAIRVLLNSTAARNAVSIWNGLMHYRAKRRGEAADAVWNIDSTDWATACMDWLRRQTSK